MKENQHDTQGNDLPAGLSQPAHRALAGAGYTHLEQVSRVSQAELMRLHGIGLKAIAQLRSALQAKGLSFTREKE